jgi:hypothetical protein
MTARPIDPESRRRPVYAAVALVLVMVAVLAAGCIGCFLLPTGCTVGDPPDNHIKVIKLTPNATMEWSQVLDNGGGNRVYRIIQTPDNNLAVYCFLENENFYGLVKISHTTGEILWKTPLNEKGCGQGALALGNNGDIISAGGPNICRINSEGAVVWNRTTRFNDTISSIMETPDNGYIVGGSRIDKYKYDRAFDYDESGNLIQLSEMKDRRDVISQTAVARIDADGNVVWQTFLGSENLHDPVRILVDRKQGTGYIAQTESFSIRFDENGKLLNTSRIALLPEADKATSSRPTLLRYIYPLTSTEYPPRVIFYDEQGFAVARLTLPNVSHVISPTDDGGYISAGIGPRKKIQSPDDYPENRSILDERLQIIKVNSDGTRAGEIPIPGVIVTGIGDIIQTSDGGYALVGIDQIWGVKSKTTNRIF